MVAVNLAVQKKIIFPVLENISLWLVIEFLFTSMLEDSILHHNGVLVRTRKFSLRLSGPGNNLHSPAPWSSSLSKCTDTMITIRKVELSDMKVY